MKVKDIEIRLEELDRMESQILFSVSILSADDHVRLARIKEERAELKAKLEKKHFDEYGSGEDVEIPLLGITNK